MKFAEAGKEVLDELKEGDVVGAAKEVVEGVAETAGAAVDAVADVAGEVVEGAVENSFCSS